jgi:translation initiation factor 2 subunit 1
MIHKKRDFPEEGDVVICRVKKVLPHCVFAELEEYEGREGMLHISEISSRWVKHIRDYAREGQRLICKVLKVDKRKGYIDLSLKRVTQGERKAKLGEWKLELRMRKLLEFIAKKFGKGVEETYQEVGSKIVQKYGALYPLVDRVRKGGKKAIEELKLSKRWKDEIFKAVVQHIKETRVELGGEFRIRCFESDGARRIRELLKQCKSIALKQGVELELKYLGTPRYKFTLFANDYKEGEAALKRIAGKIESQARKTNVFFELRR